MAAFFHFFVAYGGKPPASIVLENVILDTFSFILSNIMSSIEGSHVKGGFKVTR